jgi:DNA polymerase-3 subunit alpha
VLQQDAAVVIRGAVSNRERDDEDPPLFLDGAIPLEGVRESGEVGVCIELGAGGPDAAAVDEAKRILAEHAGPGPVTVLWKSAEEEGARLRSRTLRVSPRDDLLAALRATLGDDRVRLHRDAPPPTPVPQRDEPWKNRRGQG